jgi:hypothetical protein
MGSVPEKAAIEPAIIELLRITRLVTMIFLLKILGIIIEP